MRAASASSGPPSSSSRSNAQGRYPEAEALLREALEKQRRRAPDHPKTLSFIHGLGFSLRNQGKLDKAELYLRESLGRQLELLGGNHPDTIRSIDQLRGLVRG